MKPISWRYEIIYDRPNENYFMAEVYYNDDNEPTSWCKASLEGDSLDEVGLEIETLFKVYINQSKVLRINERGKFISQDNLPPAEECTV
jgi:hypothetical protein